ncbi:MAG: cadherin-like domain-containing protein [Verrucomicrobiota bacterium]
MEQLQRAATHRLDLEISQPFIDSDGDGMPDWWEELHGFDKLKHDAANDFDGDGVNNLAEYRAGTNPTAHANQPDLLTREVIAFADGTNALAIKTADANTPPAQLIYTIIQAPALGLKLRNTRPGTSDSPLAVGSIFTQADINAGRIVFVRGKDGVIDPLRLSLRVSDGTTTTPPTDLTIRFYRPQLTGDLEALAKLAETGAEIPGIAPAEQQRARVYLLARERGVIAWDWTTAGTSAEVAPAEAPALPLDPFSPAAPGARFAILGGASSDTIAGASENDLILGGGGNDTLTGGRGADRFVFSGPVVGNNTVSDFRPEEGDILDFGAVLSGDSTDLRDYARLSGSILTIDADGGGTMFVDAQISLPGLNAGTSDLFALFHSGRIVAKGRTLPAAVSLAATKVSASENGPTPAIFVVSRIGPLDLPLPIAISVSGSAANGQDYETLPASIVIPAGQSTAEIAVKPFADTLSEPVEAVSIMLEPGPGYALVGAASAQATIADLLPEFSIEAIEPTAVVEDAQPGVFLITRTGLVDRSLVVRLQISGNAAPVGDYTRLPTFVSFASGQTTALLSVAPLTTAILDRGAESVVVTLLANTAYRLAPEDRALVTIIGRETSAAAWRAQNFPGNADALDAFLAQDPGGLHLPNLLRYAFALDPHAPRAGESAGNLPQPKVADGHLAIEFIKSPAARDVRLIVEVSEDLRTWRSGPGFVDEITAWNPLSDGRRVLWRATKPIVETMQQTLRVRVETIE